MLGKWLLIAVLFVAGPALADTTVPTQDLKGLSDPPGLSRYTGSVLLYRHGLMLGDEGLLSPSQAQVAIETAIEECDRFYPVFQFILWGDKSPAEALAAALVDAVGEA